MTPGALRSESEYGKLDCESLYYSCQVCSNHVRYFNKREQQGETGYLIPPLPLPLPLPPSPSPLPPSFSSFYPTPARPLPLPSLENPLGEPRIPSDGPLPDVSPYHLHLYRDSTVILLPCLFAHLRATPGIPRPAGRGINGNSDFFEGLVYPRESTAQIYRRNLYVSSYVSPFSRVLSSDKRTGRRP